MNADIIQDNERPHWLARCCNYAYEDPAFLQELFGRAKSPWKFEKENFFEDIGTSTQGFIIYAPGTREIVVAFRGCRELTDFIRGFTKSWLIIWKNIKVCQNYLAAWQSVKPGIFDRLENIIFSFHRENPAENIKLYFTGHSLGAALASLAAYDTRRNRLFKKCKPGLYTFGGSYIGNKSFAKSFNALAKSFSCKHYLDPNDSFVRRINDYLNLMVKGSPYCPVAGQVMLPAGKGHEIRNYMNLLDPAKQRRQPSHNDKKIS